MTKRRWRRTAARTSSSPRSEPMTQDTVPRAARRWSLAAVGGRAASRRQQGTPADDGGHPHAAGAGAAAAEPDRRGHRGAQGGQRAARRAGRGDAQGVRRSEAGRSTTWRTTCASSARSSTTTTCASARSRRRSTRCGSRCSRWDRARPAPATREPAAAGAARRRRRAAGGASGARRSASLAAEAVRRGAWADYYAGPVRSRDPRLRRATSRASRSPIMADDAQVNIGTAYLQDGKNDKAVEACDVAIRTYPSGDEMPDAYYKKGLALQNLRDRQRRARGVGVRRQDVSRQRRGPPREAAARSDSQAAELEVESTPYGQRQQSDSGRQSRARCRAALHAGRRRRGDAQHGDDRGLERQGAARGRKRPSGTASCSGARPPSR